MKKYIIIIFLILLSSLTYASDVYMKDSTFTPTINLVTYNISRTLFCDSIWVDQYCFNITGGVDAHNYCNVSVDYIYILAPPHITPEPTTDPSILNYTNYTFNVSTYDVDDDQVSVEWYLNGTNLTDYYNYSSYNFTGNDSASYNITVIAYDTDGISSYEWLLSVTVPSVPSGDVGSTGPPGKSGYSPEEKCDQLGGLWLLNDNNSYYCKIVSSPELWINKIGAKIWPSHPIGGFVLFIVGLYLILATFGVMPKWMIFFKDDDDDDDKKEKKSIDDDEETEKLI